MKLLCKTNNKEVLREVYKVQVAIFGGPAVLIYNEDRTETYETTNPKEVANIRKFIGPNTVKTYIVGYLDKNGKIVMEKVVPKNMCEGCYW